MPQARLNITPPTQRADGTTMTAAEISHYISERLPNSGGVWSVYSSSHSAGDPILVTVNPGDAHQYRLKTVDTGGRTSAVSNAVEVRHDAIPAPPANPNPPVITGVTYLP
jgi:hypothetical protein